MTVIEFGVAAGAGLMNMCEISEQVSKFTGVHFEIVGFDSGTGMPPPRDFRDQPHLFAQGDYPMINQDALLRKLPSNARILFGPIQENVRAFLEIVSEDAPIGFVAVDVDYYWSARECLRVFESGPEQYLPVTIVYLDDIMNVTSNPAVGNCSRFMNLIRRIRCASSTHIPFCARGESSIMRDGSSKSMLFTC